MAGVFVPAPNVAEVNALYTSYSEPVENVYHVLGAGPWTQVSLDALCEAFHQWENLTAKPLRADNTQMTGVTAADISTQNGIGVEHSYVVVGTNVTGHLPNNVTVSIKANTGLRGRSFRGRTYWIGLSKGDLDATGNLITGATAAALMVVMEALRSTSFPNGGNLVVLSRRHNGAPRAQAVSTPITQYSLTDNYIDSQRRRLPKHNRGG